MMTAPGTQNDGDFRTTWVQRFSDAVARFCNGRPPLKMIEGWFVDDDDLRLQEWVNRHIQPSAAWAQGIEIIDCAERLADTPAEGPTHDTRRPRRFMRRRMRT